MYRDSQHGLTIDISGPDGNAMFLLGQARTLAHQLDKDSGAITKEMLSGSYSNLLAVFEREFPAVTLINKP